MQSRSSTIIFWQTNLYFFVDHQALLYLVNKPCSIGRIIHWFVILLEFEFMVAVKTRKTHLRVDHVSRITTGKKAIGVDDDLPDAALFQVEMVPKWSERMVHFLTTTAFDDVSSDIEEQAEFMEACQYFQLLAGQLYYLGDDNVMRLVIYPDDYESYLQEAHVSPTRIHFSKDNTLRRIL